MRQNLPFLTTGTGGGGGREIGWILKTDQRSFYLNTNANVVSFRAFLSATFI